MAMQASRTVAGNHERRDERGARIGDEEEDRRHRENQADGDAVAHAADRLLHQIGLIVEDREVILGMRSAPAPRCAARTPSETVTALPEGWRETLIEHRGLSVRRRAGVVLAHRRLDARDVAEPAPAPAVLGNDDPE